MTEEHCFDESLWKTYLLQQRELCKRIGVTHVPTEPFQILGLADDMSQIPFNGLRHPVEGRTAGWYIWTGEYNEADNFFKPVHAFHLLDAKPEIIKYLGLPVGYRFMIDNNGYEDVWHDETLLNVS
jgi:hypothetical protein